MDFALKGLAEQIQSQFSAAGIECLPDTAIAQFCGYLELLSRWNQRLNLTAVRDPAQMIQRHLVECVFASQHLPQGITSLLDYGSGAGLPGIPFAICHPELKVTLAEAQGKKASFLREALRVLGIAAEVYDGRVEDMPRGQQFDAVSMRAVEKVALAVPAASLRALQFLILFTTVQSAAEYRRMTTSFTWQEDLGLPNADQRILAIGCRV